MEKSKYADIHNVPKNFKAYGGITGTTDKPQTLAAKVKFNACFATLHTLHKS